MISSKAVVLWLYVVQGDKFDGGSCILFVIDALGMYFKKGYYFLSCVCFYA